MSRKVLQVKLHRIDEEVDKAYIVLDRIWELVSLLQQELDEEENEQ